MFEFIAKFIESRPKEKRKKDEYSLKFIVVRKNILSELIEPNPYSIHNIYGLGVHVFGERHELDEYVSKNGLTASEYFVYEFRECVKVQTITTSCVQSCKS